MFVVVLPDAFDLESDKITLKEEFETEDEAVMWLSDYLDIDKDGKLQVVFELEEADSEWE